MKKMIIGTSFFAVFMFLQNSSVSDAVKIPLIFRNVTIPVYQWLLLSIYILILKFFMSESWSAALAKSVILGVALHLYPTMLDTMKQVWGGVRLSRIYVWYINSFVYLTTLVLVVSGTRVLSGIFFSNRRRAAFGDSAFLPLFLLSIYGILFYFRASHIIQGSSLVLVSILSILVFRGKTAVSAITSIANKIFRVIWKKRRLLLIIFIFALVMRLVFFFNLWRIENMRYPYASDDGDMYDLYGTKGATDPMLFLRLSPHHWQVFYAVFLSVIYKIFGHNYIAVGVVQSAIGALLCCMVFVLANRITGSLFVSLLASLGVSMDATLILLATTMNTEVLYIPFIILVILFLLYYREKSGDIKAISLLALSGFFAGMATIIRVIGIVIAPFALLWIVIWGRVYKEKTVLRRIIDGLIFIVFTFMTIAPITYTNYMNRHKFYLVYETGSELWAVGSSAWGEEVVPSNKELIKLGMTDPIKDPHGTVKAVIARPIDVARAYIDIIPKRIRNLYLWPNFGGFDPIFLMNASQIPNRYASNLEFYGITFLFLGFVIFLFSGIKAHLKMLTLIVPCFYTIFHGMLFISIGPRYGAPLRPFLYILTSYCLYKIIMGLRSGLTEKTVMEKT